MFDVIAYLISNYQDWEACPGAEDLSEILAEAGFEHEDIFDAINCVEELAAQDNFIEVQASSDKAMRVFLAQEQDYLPPEVQGFMYFLMSENAISARQRELIVYALGCLSADEVTVEHTKLLTLMVLWAHKSELPILVGDELLVALHGNTMMQ